MSESLMPKSLAERLAVQRAEDEAIWESYQKETRARAKSEFESVRREYANYGSKLRASVGAEAERTRSAIEGSLRELRSWVARKVLWILASGVLLVIGLAMGSWGLISYLSWDIQQKIETQRELAREIEEQQQTVERLAETTWGVVLGETEQGERYVVLPRGTPERPRGHLYLGGSVIRLSRE